MKSRGLALGLALLLGGNAWAQTGNMAPARNDGTSAANPAAGQPVPLPQTVSPTPVPPEPPASPVQVAAAQPNVPTAAGVPGLDADANGDNPVTRLINAPFASFQYPAAGGAGAPPPGAPIPVPSLSAPAVRLTGFSQLDLGNFSQDAASKADLGNIQNGVGFRRARLAAAGNLSEFTSFYSEVDFASPGRPSFLDMWVQQANLPLFGNVRIGNFRQPTTMDGWTSVRHLQFLERSLPMQAFDPFRRIGAMAWDLSQDERTMWAYSVYGTGWTFWNPNSTPASTSYNTLGGDDRFGTQIGDIGGVSFATRMTHLVYFDEPSNGRYLLHVGGGYNFSEIGGDVNGDRTYDARAIPEFFVGDSTAGGATAGGTPFVADTGRILATSYNLWHGELAGSWGPAHFQTEVFLIDVNQQVGTPLFYNGAYFQTGYFLTGENTGYNKQMGVLDYNVKPFTEFFGVGRKGSRRMGGWGAWEIAARWSYVDLSSSHVGAYASSSATSVPNTPNQGIVNATTLALNWWWNQYTRVQFNWIHDWATYYGSTGSAGLPAGGIPAHGATQFNIFASRIQFEF